MATTYSVTAWRNPRSATWSKYGEYCAGWTNQSKITAIDGSGATLPSGEGINNSRKTAYLVAYNYGFVVPSNAVIVGVEIRIQKKKTTNGGTAKDYLVCLRNGPVNAPRNIGRNIARGDLWSKSYAMYGYGSSRDKLGANLTPAIVNSSTFGINFRAIGTVSTYSNIGVDGIQMRIHYAITSNTTTPPTIIEPENPDEEPVVTMPDNTEIKISDWKYPTSVVQNQEFHNPTYKNSALTLDCKSNFSNEDNNESPLSWSAYSTYVETSTSTSWYESDWYVRHSMGFNIPSNAIIRGIKVDLEFGTSAENSAPINTNWRICKPDGSYGNKNLNTHYATTANTWKWINYSQGGSNDLWGFESISPSDINDNNFKFKLKGGSVQPSRRIGINGNITITVYYTTPDGISWESTANITDTNDNTATTVVLGQNQISADLEMYGFDFNEILDTSQIIGVEVKVIHQSSVANTVKEYNINLQNMAVWYNDANQSEYISTTKTTKTHGNSTFLWNQGTQLTPSRIRNSSSFGVQLLYQNNTSSTTTLSLYTVAVRVHYLPERKTVQPNREDIELTDDETIYANVSQAPTKYYNSVKPIEFIHPPNQIRQQIGYIGTVNVIRGHHFEQISRKNDLLKETAGGAVNYSKKGTIEEDRPLSIKIPKRAIKQLEGMVDLQGIVPMDTVITMDDNDPYAMKGYVILHGIKHKRTNDLISECDIDVEFVSKDLYSPLTVDYLIKTTPPLDANIITNTENSVFYYEADTIKFIQNKTIYSNTNTPTYTYTDNGLVVSVDNDDIARIISNDTVLAPLKVIANFVYTKGSGKNIQVNLGQPNTALSDRIVLISDATTLQLRTYDRAGTQLTAETITNNANGTDYTVTINVDINGLVTATVDITDGSAITTYTFTPVTITDIADGLRSKIRIQSTSPTFDTILYEHGITKKLFSDNIDTTIRNIIHIPKPLGVNIQPDFVRQTQEGELYCYLNPSRDILFTVNPANFFDTSVKLIDDSGTRLLTTDMVINRQSEITIENSLIRVVFDVINNQIKIFGFLYGWMQIATLSLANMFHIKPIQVSFDMVHIQVGETKWLLRRGKPFVEVYHPHNDLEILDNFTHYWHDNGSGVGVVKEIENSTEPLNVNTLFYVNIYKESDNLGMQIFRPRLDNLTVKTIIKSEETGIGWYNKLAEVNERHYERALEYLAKSNQDIYVYLG